MNNPLSFSSLKLDFFSREGVHLKTASGFVVVSGHQYFLITNRHLMAPADEQPGPLALPSTLKTSLHIYGGDGGKGDLLSLGIRKGITVPLYDENRLPRWIEQRPGNLHQPPVDVAVLPIQIDLAFANLLRGTLMGSTTYKNSWTKISAIPLSAIDTDVDYGPPDTVYLIGYPHGWPPSGGTMFSSAFWRTASIASENHIVEFSQGPTFFIDPCAPEGMSGSPVIGMKNDRVKLLGVYSDRSAAQYGVRAGVVWAARLLKDLIGVS